MLDRADSTGKSAVTMDDFYNAMDQFMEAGVKIGFHDIYNHLSYRAEVGGIDFSNPQIDLDQILHSPEIGLLTGNIGQDDSTIPMDSNPANNPFFDYYYIQRNTNIGNEFLIGNEILTCQDYTTNSLTNCSRTTFFNIYL